MIDQVLDAAASDPVTMGWMQGFPPPPDKQVLWSRGDHWRFPQIRWAFSHYRSILPTVRIEAGAIAAPFARALQPDLAQVLLTPLGSDAAITVEQAMAETYTDGLMVLHRGTVVFERWFGVTGPETRHIAFSVTKSFVGTLAEILIAEGRLDRSAPVKTYVPELAMSGFGDATVGQVLDMTTGIAFREDYTDPYSGIGAYSAAAGFLPLAPDYDGPRDLWTFLTTIGREGVHGEGFTYRTANTDALVWIISRIEGRSLAETLSARLWRPLGLADGELLVDPAGTPFGGGGLNLRLEDLARFGEMLRLGGQGIVPEATVTAIRRGGDPARFDKVCYPQLPGWSYGSQWWHDSGASGAFTARGIHGQALWVDPAAQIVIARFASHPVASNSANDTWSLPLYGALTRALCGR